MTERLSEIVRDFKVSDLYQIYWLFFWESGSYHCKFASFKPPCVLEFLLTERYRLFHLLLIAASLVLHCEERYKCDQSTC